MNLKGKTIVFDGDSICQANTQQPPELRGWAARVGNGYGMEWYNYGIGGGTITAEVYVESTGQKRHWISRNIDRIHELHPTLDYLIIEGGTNDSDLLGIESSRFGTYNPSDYSGNYDDTTFTGALESLFYKALSYYPNARIGYIVAQKMGTPKIGYGANYHRRYYFLRAIEICKKWGIPYVDLWECTPLNPNLKCYYDADLGNDGNVAAGKAYVDGQHLTDVGYDLVSGRIGSFIESL